MQFLMNMQRIRSILVILVCMSTFCYGQYVIPEVRFEAFTPRGLRVSIPADKGVELFAFHGKVNKPILEMEPGDINQDVTRPINDRFTYFNTNLRLEENDVINYWVFVQHDQLGSRKNEQAWTVNRLLPLENLRKETPFFCHKPSITNVEGQDEVCSGVSIIDYKFEERPIDSEIWTIEQYIPGNPDWPFNIYRSSPDIVDIENKVLRIRPKLEVENARKDLDLNPGCTRKDCTRNYVSIWNPPVVSGQLQSKKAFCFGNFTIRAKLPIGDYIYPEIYLEDITAPERRILIAYARGNDHYLQTNGIDDGGRKLFGGPYTSVKEPIKSKYLSTYEGTEHLGSSWHTFTLVWTPDVIDLYLDGKHYGHHGSEALQATDFNKRKMVHLVLGVGIGGPYEFPDGYTSSGREKPYRSYAKEAIKDFVQNKTTWMDTWTRSSQLQIDYVIVTAL